MIRRAVSRERLGAACRPRSPRSRNCAFLRVLVQMLVLSGCGGPESRPKALEQPDAGDAAPDCPEGSPLPLNRVRFFPAPGRADRMVGGSFQGSHTGPTNDFVELAVIKEAPPEGRFTELAFENDQVYRFIKYFGPQGSHGNVAEVEFYHDQTRLSGRGFGSAGQGREGGAAFEEALDGAPETFFDAPNPTGNYVGLDLGGEAVVSAPSISPEGGSFREPPTVRLASTTPNAAIRYTVDGSRPTREHGTLYARPFTLPEGLTDLKAVASADCLFESPVVSETFQVNTDGTSSRGLRTYHIGNSLTDTINPWLEPIADSTGVDHVYARWTIPGSPIGWLWEHQGEGFEDPEGASRFSSFVRQFAPIDHISVQPFADGTLSTQGEAARAIFAAARAYSPDVQFWIYAQWPGQTEWQSDGLARGAPPDWPEEDFPAPAGDWEEATANQLRFHEAFRAHVDAGVDGKPVLVVPAGAALVNLKRAVEAGEVPGITGFFGEHFSDDLHLSAKGAYLVGLVFYACLYRQSPEGRVTAANSGLDEAQARIYQRIAWETARSYRWSGIQAAEAEAD